MGRKKMQWLLVLALWLTTIQSSPSPQSEGHVAFYRGAVESSTREHVFYDHSSKYRHTPAEYGSKTLPLRASVESIPLKNLRDLEEHRLPLRDAVEARPDSQTLLALKANSALREEIENIASLYNTHLKSNNKRYYGAAYHLNEKNTNEKLQHGNANLYEMRQTPVRESDRRLVVCYMEGWAAYRKPPLAFTAGLVPKHCTHLHYAFATVHPETYAITPVDYDFDVVKGGYRAITGLRQSRPGLRVILSVGGAGSERLLSDMVKNHVSRSAFVESAIAIIKEYDFDGLELHWAYPGESTPLDKDQLTALLYELREKFTPHDYSLSIILPFSRYLIEDNYDLSAVSGAVDYATLQAWDMHSGDWGEPPRKAVHHSPLKPVSPLIARQEKFENVEFAVKYILTKGMSKEKLVLGVPFFGRSYTLTSQSVTKPGAFVTGWGSEGAYTQTRGLLAYFEICMTVRAGRGSMMTDTAGNPYAFFKDQWVGFDNTQSIVEKMRFAAMTGLKGAAAWAIDMDDFRGLCGDKWPLLTALSEAINDKPITVSESQLKRPSRCDHNENYLASDDKSCAAFNLCTEGVNYEITCEDDTLYDPIHGVCGHLDPTRCIPGHKLRISVEQVTQSVHGFTAPSQNIKNSEALKQMTAKYPNNNKSNQNDKKVVCYMTNWSFYRRGEGKFVPEHIDTRLCTHIVYAYASLTPDTLQVKEFDPWADIDNNLFERVTSLKDSKVLLGVGGWTDSSGNKYSRLVSSGPNRQNFITKLIAFLRQHRFAGIHLDWTYPVCWQSDCKKGPASDKANYALFIEELSSELHKNGMEIGIALSGYKEIIERAYDLRSLSKSVDFFSAMTYDYHGAWEKTVAHPTPLTPLPGDALAAYSIEYAIKALISGGAEPKKMLLGITFYGQTYRLEENTGVATPGAYAAGPGEPGEFTKQPGMMAYYEICYRVKNLRWQTGKQNNAGPYAYSRDQWVGYDDQQSITEKVEWAMRQGLGGVSAWTVDLDDFSNRCCAEPSPLLRAANRAVGRAAPAPAAASCTRPPAPVTPAPPATTVVDDMMAGGGGGHHQHGETTTWPSWKPSQSNSSTSESWWPTQPAATSPAPATTTSTTTTTTSKPTTTTQQTQKPSAPSATVIVETESAPCGGNSGDYSAAGDCGSYLQCVAGVWRKHRCAPGLHWNDKVKRCDWPAAANCKQTTSEADWSSTTTTTTTSPSTPSRPPRPVTPPSTRPPRPTTSPSTTTTTTTAASTASTESLLDKACQPGVDDFTWAAGECAAYLQCVAGTWRKTRCGPGLHWSRDNKRCDWPKAAKCTAGSERPATSAIASTTHKPVQLTTPAMVQDDDDDMEMKPGSACITGTYHSASTCSQFLICVNGALLQQSCAPGLHWHSKKRMCDFPGSAHCVDKTAAKPAKDDNRRAPPLATSKPASIVLKPQALQSCMDGTFTGYPGDCARYRHCLWGKYEDFSCSAGLHWNPEKKICDWPKNSKCSDTEPSSSDEDTFDVFDNESELDNINPPGPHPARPDPPATSPHTTMRPTTVTIAVEKETDIIKSPYKLVCYFTNWAWYRPGAGKYVPEDIDPTMCTHIVYGFAVLGYEGTITAHDSWADYDNKFYERVIAYKKHGIKVSLALGGWNDSAGDKYSRLVNSASARAKFVKHAVQFLEKYGFDGLDLDWEYPKCWQVDCSKGPESDKDGFASLVRELSAEFKPRGLLLSSAVSPSKKVIDAGYDVPVMAAHMDWIAVMTYDYHGQWDKKTGHVAPLYLHPEDDVSYFNSNFTMHYWMEKGAPASKLVMGMPLYGQSFTLGTQWDTPPELLAKRNGTGLNVPARAGGEAGEFTRAKGFLAYYEICDRIKNRGWTVVRDPRSRMGPYAFRGDQWVSFDDVHIIKKKVKFIRSLNLAGGMVWALDLDDFRNRCGEGKHPLLTTIRDTLIEKTTKEDLMASVALQFPDTHTEPPQDLDARPDVSPFATPPTVDQDIYVPSGGSTGPPQLDGFDMVHVSEYKVVCYFTNWAWYRPGPGKFTPADIDPKLCTHIVYAFAVLDGDRLTIKPHDSWADIDNKFYEKVLALKARGIKVLLGLGGWNDSAGDKYSRLVNSAAARRTFVVQALDFIEQYGFDGLDLDWEYPKCWQVDCNKGPSSDKEGFSSLVRELRAAFDPKNLLLSAAVSPSKRVIDNAYDVPVLSDSLDWIAVMTYDYHGQWDKRTGHVAPMYERSDDADKTFNANFTMHYWIAAGAARRKLVMGLPLYGQSFSLAEGAEHGLDAPTYGGGEAGDETRARGFLAFYEICERVRVRDWKVVRDASGRMGPYATRGDQWVSFDDDFMIQHKAQYIRAMGLGGGMVWALDLDDFSGKYCGCGKSPLLANVNHVLRGQPPVPMCALEESPMLPEPITLKPTTELILGSDMDSLENNELAIEEESCSGNSFKPDPHDCGKYYLCNNGRYTQLPCPPPLHWNQDRCDWPSKSKCNKDKMKTRIASFDEEIASAPKVVCYFTNWAFYRMGNGSFGPEDVDTSLCTHVVYAWATLSPKTLTMEPRDSVIDIDNDFFGKMSALRLKGLKVLMGVGGWEDSSNDKWSRMANSPRARDNFINSAVEFLRRWQFDGLEISWQYPVCWQASCQEATAHSADRDGYSVLMSKLAARLRAVGYLLSASVSAAPGVAARAYHAADLVAAADWLTVAAYDYHGAWEQNTNYAMPLLAQTDGDLDNVNASISFWLEAGVPASKLVLGIPFYGQSYTLRDPNMHGVGALAVGPGEAGPLTDVPGFLAYHEICSKRHEDWHVSHSPLGSYAWRARQWVSYTSAGDAARAVRLALSRGVRSVAAWALDLDDWRGLCGCGAHPLLKTLRNTLLDPNNKINMQSCLAF